MKHTKMRRLEPDEDDLKDGITFDSCGRMKYHPEFHENHGKPFSRDDIIYLCKYYEIDGSRNMSFALGKTEATVMGKICELRKENKFDYYRNYNEGA